MNTSNQIVNEITPELKEQHMEQLIMALKTCLRAINLLQKSNPLYMTMFLRLAYRQGLSLLKKYEIGTQEIEE